MMCIQAIQNWFNKKHGFAKILLPVQYPMTVEPNNPFTITYTIKNTGQVTDVLWAKLIVNGQVLPNSYWSKRIQVGSSITKIYSHPGINKDTVIILLAGY